MVDGQMLIMNDSGLTSRVLAKIVNEHLDYQFCVTGGTVQAAFLGKESYNKEHRVLDIKTALRAYASMINTLDSSKLEPLLSPDFHYASQMVWSEIESKQEYLDYINPKLEVIRASGIKAWAEMAMLTHSFPGPCVALAQGGKEDLVALVLVKVKGDLIQRIDMCIVPAPQSAKRSGKYPL